ncbi:MAG: transporter substrate-binding domain-containing protein, partial [Spirochaetes bacterium]|nr:transporter substrate-binding domain-containing protein [Spirochaetota bacterium]
YKTKNYKLTYSKLSDLKKPGITIGTVSGYVNPEDFVKANLKTEESKSDLINMKKLLAGRLQLVLVDKLVGFYLVKSDSEMSKKANQLEWIVTLTKNGLMNGVAKNGPKDWQKVLADFNKGLQMIKKNGKFDQIMKKHGLK